MPLDTNTAALHVSSLSEVDSGYAWWRLFLTLILGTVACVGNWSVVVLLPALELEFGTVRGVASLPYTSTMVGFALGPNRLLRRPSVRPRECNRGIK